MTDTRSMTLLDESGDTVIAWDSEDGTDAKMLAIIEEKMKQGFVFYLTKEMPVLKVKRLTKAKNIEEIKKAGSVTIKDEALEKLFLAGHIGTAKVADNHDITTVRRAANANEVVTNHSVAVRPQRGG